MPKIAQPKQIQPNYKTAMNFSKIYKWRRTKSSKPKQGKWFNKKQDMEEENNIPVNEEINSEITEEEKKSY